MELKEAIRSRKSVRQFKDTPIRENIIKDILENAKWAASGGNLQPWNVHVLGGEALQDLVGEVRQKLRAGQMETPEYNVYPPNLKDPYKTRRRVVGQALYELIGVPREDKAGKLKQLAKNFEFFGAPVGLFFTMDRQMEIGQFVDLGIFMQNIMLMARDYGLHTCPQEAWAQWPETTARFLGVAADEMVFCGMALGEADEGALINQLQSERAELDEFVSFRGF
ncbi:MAG: nitroreductase [Sneathiella sp.]|nr:nitroreductase [Sneathiella sp.]